MISWPELTFLFRREEGRIDAATWRQGALILAAPMLALTLGWFALLPFANRDLTERAFVDPMAIVVYVYLLIYSAAILLAAVCLYFLSAKRWRDLGRSPELAGAPLVAALVTGGVNWLQPRVSEVLPWVIVGLCDAALAVVIIWQVYWLGVAGAARAKPSRS